MLITSPAIDAREEGHPVGLERSVSRLGQCNEEQARSVIEQAPKANRFFFARKHLTLAFVAKTFHAQN